MNILKGETFLSPQSSPPGGEEKKLYAKLWSRSVFISTGLQEKGKLYAKHYPL